MYIIKDRRKLQNAYLEPVLAFGNPRCAEIFKLSLLNSLHELEGPDESGVWWQKKRDIRFIQSLLLKPFEQWAEPNSRP